MLLRCQDGTCRRSVDVGTGDTESWRLPLWDHLFDHHFDLVALGRHSEVRFKGPGVSRCHVTEKGVSH